MPTFRVAALLLTVIPAVRLFGEPPDTLLGTRPLVEVEDRSAQMVAGIERYLDRATDHSMSTRSQFWQQQFSSGEAYAASVEPNRKRLRRLIGAVDQRLTPVQMEYVAGPDHPAVVAETSTYRLSAVRWNVLTGVAGEGLLAEPKAATSAHLVVLPDADQTPEMLFGLEPGIPVQSQFARRLAEIGCQVLVPVLIDRGCQWSGNPAVAMTNQTHREWVWRQAFEMGRHLVGYEVQKVEAAVDWLSSRGDAATVPARIGVVGYGEGGLIALYSAALDRRIRAALVSGYFDSRQELWSEPIYRNVFGLLREFGDAEISSLIAPRALVVEQSAGPSIAGPPAAEQGRRDTAAPGRLVPPESASVRAEVERARRLVSSSNGQPMGLIDLVMGENGETVRPGSDRALETFLQRLEVAPIRLKHAGAAELGSDQTVVVNRKIDGDTRQRRQIDQLVEYSQRLLRRSDQIRAEFWKDAAPKSGDAWPSATRAYRNELWNEVVGKLPDPVLPANARTRKIDDRPRWTMYEAVLDVWPDVFAWGYLLVPKGIPLGERRPVVVCQHGLEGLPESVVIEDESNRSYRVYRAFAVRLAERGFVVFAPHNPYRGGTSFRQLNRKAQPLQLTLYSFILGQHQRILEWLTELPFVDGQRIGFYGLSYGGVSALRIPALLDGYHVSICSAAFNDWASKVMSLEFRASYMFTHEYDHFNFGLAATFNNAELAALIAPRPFMVERGHRDGVAPDEWVASEFAQVRRLYTRLGIPERTEIEFFDGGHEIHGQRTFAFLHRWLDWPEGRGS